MSRKYKIHDQKLPYFITSTVINWIDVFTRNPYRDIVIDSLKFCRKHKGLKLYAYCIMTNHIHLIIGTRRNDIQEIVRDFKSFTSRKLRKSLESNNQESRSNWILPMMYDSGLKIKSNKDFQFWQQNYHPIELSSETLMNQKLEYIHLNPVKSGFVTKAENYLYSSARNYAGLQSVIDLDYYIGYGPENINFLDRCLNHDHERDARDSDIDEPLPASSE